MSNYSFDTFGNVIDEAYDELAVDGTANTYPGLSSSNMQKWGNRYAKNFISKVNLKSQEGTDTFLVVADTTLNDSAPNAGDTTVTIVDSTGWPASGLCLIDDVPMTFTRSSLVLTVAALPRDFDDGDTVQLAYALPSDFLRPVSIFLDGSEYALSKKGDRVNVSARSIAIYGDYYVLPKGLSTGGEVVIHYMKKGTNTMTTGTTMEIMDYFDGYVVSMLIARGHRCMYDEDRAQVYEKQAMQIMKMAISHFNKADGTRNKMFIPGF